tara:strand:+ start:41 stop:280 length:240 start_codon:yes stop_codon:yes gene_type:complete
MKVYKDNRGNHDLEVQIESLQLRVRDLEQINETHQHLNGDLRVQIQKLESESIKDKNLLQGYKKVIEELTNKLRRRSES